MRTEGSEKQGWHSGESITSQQCGLGSIPGVNALCGLSLLLVFGPAPKVFLRVLWFNFLHKNQHSQIPIGPGNSR